MTANDSFLTAAQSSLLSRLLNQHHNVTTSIEDMLWQQSHQLPQQLLGHRTSGLVTMGNAMDPAFLRLDLIAAKQYSKSPTVKSAQPKKA